ncbi:MAG TPA: hypothetical protein VEQ37_20630 [Actinomycetota bacterium]|nr:hypothetical protein [Actinomycetota bacterium]
MSGATRKLLHRSRDRTRAEAAQEGPIGRGEQGSPAAATEDPELVAEHGLLEIQLVETAANGVANTQTCTGWTQSIRAV